MNAAAAMAMRWRIRFRLLVDGSNSGGQTVDSEGAA
jgi:hypothetical protein